MKLYCDVAAINCDASILIAMKELLINSGKSKVKDRNTALSEAGLTPGSVTLLQQLIGAEGLNLINHDRVCVGT
jgi:hypothetical protein